MQKFRLALFNGIEGEEVNVVRRELTKRGVVMHLDAPLRFAYPKGCDPHILKSQQWGIILTGPESRGNVVSGNQCSENLLGGILSHNEDGAMGLNVGTEAKVDPDRSFSGNLHPAVGVIGPINGDFEEDGGWVLNAAASLVDVGYRGRRSLQIIPAKNADHRYAQSDKFELKPQTRYRLSGWIKISGDFPDTGEQLKQPLISISLATEQERAWAGLASGGTNGCCAGKEELKTDVWQLYEGELVTGCESRYGKVMCQLNDSSITVWFDDIIVEEIKPYALRPFGEEAAVQ